MIHAALGLAPRANGRRVVVPPGGELLRLSYPLSSGAEWTLRLDPDLIFTESVEGVDALHTPAGTFAAYRLAIHLDLFGPNDRVVVWYGREGFLGLDAHLEVEGTDDQGNVVTVVFDERQHVTGVSLVERTHGGSSALE